MQIFISYELKAKDLLLLILWQSLLTPCDFSSRFVRETMLELAKESNPLHTLTKKVH